MTDREKHLTGIVSSAIFEEHDPGPRHPESPSRIEAVRKALGAASLEGRLRPLTPRAATEEEILLVHTRRLYQEVEASGTQEHVFLDPDTVTSARTAEVARWAAGSVLSASESVLAGEVTQAFALVRPPGHHAKPDKAMGFCFYNNVAIAAQAGLRGAGLARIAILDFDVHHGNGTQKIFYTSPEVLYVSTHQWPHYPGTGAIEEIGKDSGEGFTLNIPMPAGMGDAEYAQIFREVVVPACREFAPELIFVSAGFDAHRLDPLGGMQLTHAGYAELARQICRLARETCEGKVVFALEGGYHLPSLERSIRSVLEVLSGVSDEEVDIPASSSAASLIERIRRRHRAFWPSLK